MLDKISKMYEILKSENSKDPLYETLRIVDILSKGALRSMDLSLFDKVESNLAAMAQKRKENMPWEYIIGRASFMGRLFYCTQDTLIPTEETSLLVKTAVDFITKKQEQAKDLTLIDMGTGCGNIAISIALHSEAVKILASDVSVAAIEVAKKNVDAFNVQDKMSLFCGDLFAPFVEAGYHGKIDLIVSNPPYIPTSSLKNLAAEIIDYEPVVALDAGPYGINIFRRLISESVGMLKPKGALIFEIGIGQEKLVRRLIEKHGGYEDIKFYTHDNQIKVISAVKKL